MADEDQLKFILGGNTGFDTKNITDILSQNSEQAVQDGQTEGQTI